MMEIILGFDGSVLGVVWNYPTFGKCMVIYFIQVAISIYKITRYYN